MRDPKLSTYTNMNANAEMWHCGIVNPDLRDPSIRLNLVPRSGISDRVRDANAVVFRRLADSREYKSGSLREKISEVAPFANDYDSEDRIDE